MSLLLDGSTVRVNSNTDLKQEVNKLKTMYGVIAARSSSSICRYFSRTTLPFRESQGGNAVNRNSDQWILVSAACLSIVGFGLSLFSTRQLYDTSHKSFFKK